VEVHQVGWNADAANRAGFSGFDDYNLLGEICLNLLDL